LDINCPGSKVFVITPNTGYEIFEVTVNGASVGTVSTVTVYVPPQQDVVAYFAIKTFSLSYTPGLNGTITGAQSQTVEYGGSGSLVTAVADSGYHFAGWNDGVATAARQDTNVKANVTATANFAVDTFTLTYTAGTNGSISGTTPQSVPKGGNGTSVTAVANTGYHFTSWSDGLTTAVRQDTNITANKSVTANFAIDTFTLTYICGSNGALSGTTSQTVNYGANGSQVTATAVTGYHFAGWSDGRTDNPRQDNNVTHNINVTANFAVDTFTLTYTSDPEGSISGTATQTINYGESGTPVTATPNAGQHFAQWSDGSTSNPRTDSNVTRNITVKASYNSGGYNLTYSTNGNGYISGNTPQTVNHGGSGTTVTAVPSTGNHFSGWSDGVTTAARTDTNVTHNIVVTAYFDINTYTLTYIAGLNGTISGTTPQTVNHGENGAAVTAVANFGFHFVNWNDGWTGDTRHETNVTSTMVFTANFAINTYTLTYRAGVWGSISGATPQTVNHGGAGTAVTAVPDQGYRFVNWSDGVTTATRTDAGVTHDIDVTANFSPLMYTLTYTAGANGTISGTSPQIVPRNGSGTAVTAVPDIGYHFVIWSDGLGTATRQDTNVTTNIAVTANFAINTYTLTYTAGANGTISGATPQTVNHGASGAPVTAVANTGYHFTGWSDGLGNATRQDTNVTASKSVTANFAINTYTLTYTAGAHGSVTGASPQTVNHGGSGAAVTAVPVTGYHFVNWSDGNTANPRTDTNVTASISVTANFAINTYTLTYTAGDHGSITGLSPQTVNHGANGSAVTAVADANYHFVNWSDSTPTNPRTDNPRIDTNITVNINVTANFAINTYTLTYTAGAHGSISGTSPQTVNHGAGGSTVTAIPDTGYHFVNWSDGSTTNPRTDTNVTHNISATANFAVDTINTSPGSNVAVQPANNITGATPVTLTFPTVTQAGITTLSSTTSGQTPPGGFKMAGSNVYYQISTTAVFSGKITISISYDPTGINSPNQLKLFHFENGNWVDVTTSLDTTNHIIYGSVSSLSPFGVFEPGSFIFGDANGDGIVNMGDVTKTERIILSLDTATPGADANGDGAINMGDVTKIERIILKLDP
jgi:hypothetical protein